MAVDLKKIFDFSLAFKRGDRYWSTPLPVKGHADEELTEADALAACVAAGKDLGDKIQSYTHAAVTAMSRVLYRNVAVGTSTTSNVVGGKTIVMNFEIIPAAGGKPEKVQIKIPEADLANSGYANEGQIAAAISPHLRVFGEDDEVLYKS